MDLPRISKPSQPAGLFGAAYVACCVLCLPLYMRNGYIGLISGKFSLLLSLVAIGCAAAIGFSAFRKIPVVPGILQSGGSWLLVLCASYGAAAFFSTNRYTSIWGQFGRNNGLLLFLACTLLFFVVRLFFSPNFYPVMEACISYSVGIVAMLGWLNYWTIDPFGVYYSVFEQDRHMFLSTIGNINFFGSFLCLFTPVSIGRALRSRRTPDVVCAVAAMSAFVPANSDGTWIAAAVCILILLCTRLSADTFGQLCKLGVFCCLVWALNAFRSFFFVVQGPLRTVSAFVGALPVALFCGVILGSLYFANKKYTFPVHTFGIVLCTIAVVCVMLGLIVRNLLGISLGALDGIFFLDQTWGSNRGYLWFLLCIAYGRLPILQKLFGAGGDIVYDLLNPHYTNYIVALNGSTFDSAHNEFLQHLICGGIVGLVSWCGFLFSRIRACSKYSPAFAFSLLCYAVQSFFSISMPAVFPIVFVFAAIGSCSHKTSAHATTQDNVFISLISVLIVGVALIISQAIL